MAVKLQKLNKHNPEFPKKYLIIILPSGYIRNIDLQIRHHSVFCNLLSFSRENDMLFAK